MTDRIASLIDFLRGIGLQVQESPLDVPSFLPGVAIVDGGLRVDRAQLLWPGDLLHEAGHLAVIPAALRPLQSGDLHHCEDIPHAGEIEAIAWAYAAACATGLGADALFHAGGYHGHGPGLAFTYGCGVYPGLPGLSAAGMALGSRQAEAMGAPAYPRMRRWLRE